MSVYYIAGLPYSDELYHHGIQGQKWGVRRYQNSDGSLTPEGRVRYGGKESAGEKIKRTVSSAGRSIGNTARKAANTVSNAARATKNYAVTQTKKRHPSLMTDDELRDYTQRLIQEKNYSRMMSEMHSNGRGAKAREFVGDVLKNGVRTLANAGFQKMANEMTKSKLERENDELSQRVRKKEMLEKLAPSKKESGLAEAQRIMNDPNSSASDIKKANETLKNYFGAKSYVEKLNGSSNSKATKEIPVAAPIETKSSEFKMRPLESMGELSIKNGGSTRPIVYDPPRTGSRSDWMDERNIRNIQTKPKEPTKKAIIPASWEEEYALSRKQDKKFNSELPDSWAEEYEFERRRRR